MIQGINWVGPCLAEDICEFVDLLVLFSRRVQSILEDSQVLFFAFTSLLQASRI